MEPGYTNSPVHVEYLNLEMAYKIMKGENMSKIEVKIDYLSVTFPLDCNADDNVLFKVHEMVGIMASFFNVEAFEISKDTYAQNNFNYQYKLGENIVLRLDGPLNECYQKTCHLELKGEGCREFEVRCKEKNWHDLFIFLVCLNAKFKRIDIAIDDYSGEDIQLDYIHKKIKNHYFTSVFKSNPKPIGTLKDGLTLQFGTNRSDTELVIYDKLKERISRKKEVDKDYWVRYEMRFRNNNAEKIVLMLVRDFDKLMITAYEQLYRLLDIKEDNSYNRREQSRVNTDSKWTSFLNGVEKGIIPKSTFDKTATFENYLKSAKPYISTFLLYLYKCVGHQPDLFEMEIYKFMKNELKLSKKAFKNLNIYLANSASKPIDDTELAIIKNEAAKLIEEKSLPF